MKENRAVKALLIFIFASFLKGCAVSESFFKKECLYNPASAKAYEKSCKSYKISQPIISGQKNKEISSQNFETKISTSESSKNTETNEYYDNDNNGYKKNHRSDEIYSEFIDLN